MASFRGHRIIHGVTSLAKYRCNVLHVRFYGKHFKKEPVIKPKKEPTVDQQAIVEALKKHNVAVIARPGSGKTETARFASLANPSWNILFLTYSRALKERAQKDFRHLKHVNVQTIHGALSDLYEMTIDTDVLLRKLRREGIQPLWNRNQYDLVIVDETQDLNPDLYWAIRMIASNPSGPVHRMLVLGDPQQTIFGYRNADSRYLTEYESVFKGISPDPWKCKDLPTSLRLTIPNAALANEYIEYDYIRGTIKDPSPLPLYIVANLQENASRLETKQLVDIIKPLIKHYGNDTAILAPQTHNNRSLARLVNRLVWSRFGVRFAMTREDESSKSPKALENKVLIGTFHGLKGDDRSLVIVFQADSSHPDSRPGEPCPKPIFVALTRVKEQLVLVQSHTTTAFHGTSEENLRQLTEYKDLATCKSSGRGKTQKRKQKRTHQISREVRHLPMDILEEALRDIVVVDEIRAPCYDGSPLPSLIPISKYPRIHEPVEDLNENTLVEAMLLKSKDESALPFSFSPEESRDIANRVLEKDESASGFYFRRPQLSEAPNWLSRTGLEEAVRRVTEVFDTVSRLEYNHLVEGKVNVSENEQHTLKGSIDIYDPPTESGGIPTIYGLKLKTQLSPEDLIQLLFHGVLEAMMRRKKDPQLPRMILYNVADGQQLQLRAHSFERALEYMVKLLRLKQKPLKGDAPTPREDFLQQSLSIQAEVQNAKPYSGPIKGKWWEWRNTKNIHSPSE
ncbi:hypothetical protein FRC20_001900 [Serendipita sp. 405]|nr:hypothetical protein FRC20_001900 [Serendipita sp. 405]